MGLNVALSSKLAALMGLRAGRGDLPVAQRTAIWMLVRGLIPAEIRDAIT